MDEGPFDELAGRIHAGGALMVPLLLWAALSPFTGLALFVAGALIKRKVWALRFGLFATTAAIFLPLFAWWRAVSLVQQAEATLGTVGPADADQLRMAAEAEAMNLPWAALMGSPFLLAFGLALFGVALLNHPSVAQKPLHSGGTSGVG